MSSGRVVNRKRRSSRRGAPRLAARHGDWLVTMRAAVGGVPVAFDSFPHYDDATSHAKRTSATTGLMAFVELDRGSKGREPWGVFVNGQQEGAD